MRKGGGKAKGASFERDICRQLSLWVSAGQQEDVFWRSAMSGGRSTVAHAKGKRMAAQAGDISCIHHIGSKLTDRFLLECKNYKDLNIAGLITGKGNLIDFWNQTFHEAKRYDKLPFLIAKQNRMPTLICLSVDGVLLFAIPPERAILVHNESGMYVLNAADFFSSVSPP
jgi:hypothetical protein